MNKTTIEWCDESWNPITGCKHPCRNTYCYNTIKATSPLNRFGAAYFNQNGIKVREKNWKQRETGGCHVAQKGEIYPYGYDATLYPHRLAEPLKVDEPKKIFTVDTGDLMGSWVPKEWINSVLDITHHCPQHTFMLLTKNPARYQEFQFPANCWLGTTITCNADSIRADILKDVKAKVRFLSIEPLTGEVTFNLKGFEWVIVGAMTGKDSVVPDKAWVDGIVAQCVENKIPLFMKNNLTKHFPMQLIQQFPKGK